MVWTANHEDTKKNHENMKENHENTKKNEKPKHGRDSLLADSALLRVPHCLSFSCTNTFKRAVAFVPFLDSRWTVTMYRPG